MRNRFVLALAATSLAAPLLVACSSTSSPGAAGTPTSPAGSDDAGATTPANDASASPPGDASTPPGTNGDSSAPAGPTANVRVAHLSPDAPAVDFCLAAHGSGNFTGPVLKGAGVSAGISYPSVTQYLSVPVGQYDVRLVAPGAADCSTSLAGLPDYTSLPALSANGSFTVAAEGEVTAGGTPFGLTAYVDDATVTSGKAALRFVHASPGTPAVDVGTGAGSSFAAVYTDVAFGAVATAGGGIDANGYLVTPPLSATELSARAHGATTDALIIASASLPAGAIATAFAIGKLGSTTTPLAALLCVDSAAPTAGLSSCSVVGDSLAHVRVAHLSPDAPAVDVCIKSHSATAWPTTPLLASLSTAAGLSYPQVTTYVNLPVDAYDLRIVAAPATSCATGVVPDTSDVAVTVGLYATVAATGDLTVAGSDPGFALKVFVDERTAPAGMGSLRFIHASPSTPAVDVGVGTGSSFTKVFPDVAFGKVAASSASIDANGYYATAPLANVNVTARIANASTDALTVPGISLAAGEVATAFAIGAKTGQTTKNPLQVLLCDDTAAPTGVLTTCLAPAP
jgi:hypothetical protein